MRYVLLSLMVPALSLLATSGAYAVDDRWGDNAFERRQPTEPRYQVAMGWGHRIDGEEDLDASGTLTGDFFVFVSDAVAWKMGLQYNNYTRRRMVSARYWSFSFGPRFQVKSRLVSPFAEFQLGIHRYEGHIEDRALETTKGGLALAGGLSLSLGDHGFIDVAVRLQINHVEEQVMAVQPGVLPPDDQSFVWQWGPLWQNYENSLYNPATLEVHYRLGL